MRALLIPIRGSFRLTADLVLLYPLVIIECPPRIRPVLERANRVRVQVLAFPIKAPPTTRLRIRLSLAIQR